MMNNIKNTKNHKSRTFFSNILVLSCILTGSLLGGCYEELGSEPRQFEFDDPPKERYDNKLIMVSELAGQVESTTCRVKFAANELEFGESDGEGRPKSIVIKRDGVREIYNINVTQNDNSGFEGKLAEGLNLYEFTVTDKLVSDQLVAPKDVEQAGKIECFYNTYICGAPNPKTDGVELEEKCKDQSYDYIYEVYYDCEYPCAGGENLEFFWKNATSEMIAQKKDSSIIRFSSGDNFGVSSALSNNLSDVPVIKLLNDLGLDVDSFGNHNFDSGLSTLRNLVKLSNFPYTISNLKNVPQNGLDISPYYVRNMGGMPVAVVGTMDEGAFRLVFPGTLGTVSVGDYCTVRNTLQDAYLRGVRGFILSAHVDEEATKISDDSDETFPNLYDFMKVLLMMGTGEEDHFSVCAQRQDKFADPSDEIALDNAIFDSIVGVFGTSSDELIIYNLDLSSVEGLAPQSTKKKPTNFVTANKSCFSKDSLDDSDRGRFFVKDFCFSDPQKGKTQLWYFRQPNKGASLSDIDFYFEKKETSVVPGIPDYNAVIKSINIHHTLGKPSHPLNTEGKLDVDYCKKASGNKTVINKDNDSLITNDRTDDIAADLHEWLSAPNKLLGTLVENVKFWRCNYYEQFGNSTIFIIGNRAFNFNQKNLRELSTKLGNLIVTAMGEFSNQFGARTDFVILNSGSIRTGFSGTAVTKADIETILSYKNNTLSYISMSVPDIVKTLNKSISFTTGTYSEFGGFLMVDGFRFSYTGAPYYKEHKYPDSEQLGTYVTTLVEKATFPKEQLADEAGWEETESELRRIHKENVIFYLKTEAESNKSCASGFKEINLTDLVLLDDTQRLITPPDFSKIGCAKVNNNNEFEKYTVLTNNFLETGGDGHKFSGTKINIDKYKTASEISVTDSVYRFFSNDGKNKGCETLDDKNCETITGLNFSALDKMVRISRIDYNGVSYASIDNTDEVVEYWRDADNQL